MSSDARAGVGALVLPRLRDRDVLLAFALGLAISICWRSPTAESIADLSADVLRARSGIGAAELLAISVLATVAFRFGEDRLLTASDLCVIAVTSLAFAFPLRMAAGIPLTVVGIKLLFRPDPRASSFGQILLALAFYEWFGPALFHLLSPWLLKLETIAVQAALMPMGGFTRDDLMISTGGGLSIMIEEGCSAFQNVSLASLIWISLVKLDTLTMRRVHLWIWAAMAAATVALNTVRIALMAQSDTMFDFWHGGGGVPIVSFTILATMLLICLSGLRLAETR
jgi:hypothetical protein